MRDGTSILETIGRGWRIIAISAVVACVSAVAISVLVPTTYESEARLLVNASDRSLETTASLQDGVSDAPAGWIGTQAELLRWRRFRVEAIQRLKLDLTPEELDPDVSVGPVDDTRVISIKVRNKDAKTAADVANTLAAIYVTTTRDMRAQWLKSTGEALSGQLTATTQEVAQIDGQQASGTLTSELITERRLATERLDGLSVQLQQVRTAQDMLKSWTVPIDAAVPATTRRGPTLAEAALIGAIAGFLLGAVVVLAQEAERRRLTRDEGSPAEDTVPLAPAPLAPAPVRREWQDRRRLGA